MGRYLHGTDMGYAGCGNLSDSALSKRLPAFNKLAPQLFAIIFWK